MIGIVDYGLGNLQAFLNVYNRLDIAAKLVSCQSHFEGTTKLILPGVGAFDHAMKLLNKSGLRDHLEKAVLVDSIPVMGVCVGMQIMARSSEEGVQSGLSWLPGVVRKFTNSSFPLPHMGWNKIHIQRDSPLLANLDSSQRFYFLHSYYFCPDDMKNVTATCSYPESFACIATNKNIVGIQCHPEKSHHNGISVLRNFAVN